MDALSLVSAFMDGEAATAGAGPTGAPSGGTWDGYGSGAETEQLLRLEWTNTDATAYTRAYNGAVQPGNLIDSAALPGATSMDTSLSAYASYTINITHYKNGQESAADTFTAGYLA